MRITILFLLISCAFVGPVQGQVDDYAIRLSVLHKAEINRTFRFGRWNDHGGMETHLTYLGKVTTSKGRTYRVMNSIWIWGLSRRGTTRILIFDSRERYVGNYYLGNTADVPSSLKNGVLYFSNINNDQCDRNVMTRVSLRGGLPKNIFKKCHANGMGDFISFEGD